MNPGRKQNLSFIFLICLKIFCPVQSAAGYRMHTIIHMNLLKTGLALAIGMLPFCLLHAQLAANEDADTMLTKEALVYPDLVSRFYAARHQKPFWFSGADDSGELRRMLVRRLDSASSLGLDGSDYHPLVLTANLNKNFSGRDSSRLMATDRIFTDAAIHYCKDLRQGAGISRWIETDQVSPKLAPGNDEYIIRALLAAGNGADLVRLMEVLQPDGMGYPLLKTFLREKNRENDSLAVKKLIVSLNLLRWLTHFQLPQYIVVNIPSATLFFVAQDTLRLTMKVVLGKPSTPTPRFASFCNEIILYPYWNVPRKIAVNELLPLFKKNPNNVNAMDMQIVDGQGHVLDPFRLPWASYSKKNFPYMVRQSTGCDNALGVVKFNLTSPFDVYMHDTNFKTAFLSSRRYYSHGCIRLEKPIELANLLLGNKLDSVFLQSCLKNQQPVHLSVAHPVPVFVLYMPVVAVEGETPIFFPDVYHLIR